MGMREYPDATYKVDYAIIKKIDGYSEFINKLKELNIDLDRYAQSFQYGDDDLLREAISDNSEKEDLEDEYINEQIKILDELLTILTKNFSKEHKGFGVTIRWINSDCEGDVRESFFELTGYVKPKASKIGSWVGWTEWA